MTVFRRWILPIAWLAVFAVIAAALVKLAFFPDDAPESAGGGHVPTGALTEPQIAAWRDTVRTDLEIDATISSDPALPVKVHKPGTVIDVFFAVGAVVSSGDILASVREETTSADGEPVVRWSEIVAPAGGTLSALSVLSGQTVAVGDEVGAVAPSTFRVQGSIAPADRYGLLHEPKEAKIAIAGGPAPFTCTGLVLETPLPGASPGPDATATAGASEITTTVRCPVPGDVRVFPGLSATMTIAGGLAENVVVVPVTAVLGGAGSGVVFVPGDTGEPVERQVTLGISDGVNIEVVGGLEEGETLFEYVPGSSPGGDGEDCAEVAPGVIECTAGA